MTGINEESLRQLADCYGIATFFWDWRGHRRDVSAATITAILAAVDVDASSDDAIAQALSDHEDAPWRQMVPASTVIRHGNGGEIFIHLPDGDPVEAWLELDDDPRLGGRGGQWRLEQAENWDPARLVDGVAVGRAAFTLPRDLPLGWHTIHARTPRGEATGTVVVCPQQAPVPESLWRRHGWGLMAQLYSVRSARSWGVGDFQDLGDLAWASAHNGGADFVLINPVAACEPIAPVLPSPYLPVSRAFLSPLYIRPQAIEEYAYVDAFDRGKIENRAFTASILNADASTIDRDTSWKAKSQALRIIFRYPRSAIREARFAAFCDERGRELDDFALWSALVAEKGGDAVKKIAGPDSPQAKEFAAKHADDLEFYRWLQWIADQQLAAAQAKATDAGMRLGIMHDLPVGVSPDGADAWAKSDILAQGITVGAPPDYFNQLGQNWSQPPWRPDMLARTGYAAYKSMLRALLAHAGAIRIDHIIGLFRLWWIPSGGGPQQGTYLRYNHEDMVNILVLEAVRAGAVIIGEDLGTVEPWVREYLGSRNILGTSIVWFEKADDGVSPKPADWYRPLALSSVTTHDLPPTAAYLAGEHVILKEKLNLLTTGVDEEEASSAGERDTLLRVLCDHGFLDSSAVQAYAAGRAPADIEVRAVIALHRFLASTPSILKGISLTDITGERRAQNMPGTDTEYPNWKMPLTSSDGHIVTIETLVSAPPALWQTLIDAVTGA